MIESFSQVIFGIINMIMRLAPIGAFGAMAFTIGKYGVGSLVQLGQLIICFYITCISLRGGGAGDDCTGNRL
ncbi:C4-dicarboxylate transporter DctA [Salmonella enterica subsp. enterica]|uniref:C4-dicarboxylate transporter DctA n=1 Tax=Salmonella enterica I TaxID=59201 RepID=A0A379W2K7_SALET|nr:C4-dicarboxylate transporter DctA [Salmonella enterica subsp. enterica]